MRKIPEVVQSIRARILSRMLEHGWIGGKHTAIEHLSSGIEIHRGKDVSNAVKSLIKEGLIIPKITHYGLQVSLNPRMLDKVKRIIEEES